MAVRDLLPWGRNTSPSVPSSTRGEPMNPFLTLHREMNRLFDDVFSGFEARMPGLPTRGFGWPSVEMVETDQGLRVSAELPGLDENDVELLIEDGALTLRGEKRAETTDKERGYSERSYGRFERVIVLPFAVEEDKAEASFKNGVLSVTLPRSAKAPERGRRIAINGGTSQLTAH
ncbi:Hsp20/alpha crystallin family protein [Methylobacterium gnaphalii]|uniref:Molecular chaperone Hsp20 n=1 Tax=Methylobacterium gnaphalii TaxID=1010610 RepID=A0A512JJP7_9HYPH|nr:Hsp20/alpha crystallin family protein [Methylobacterium gnaphalii]GEP10178.1 molecular chaperone Hsp20 [Methylobacterium gnaphalii]GJD69514.1 Small heat shock protein IbpA [Methylobacterium gnaphalii]GLS48694.1 molecular chaperone Hsp20 [Methylobacterium gnaphalii]